MPRKGVISEETLKRFLEAFNRHDVDAIMTFFAEDCVMDTPRGPHSWGQRFEGRAAVREAVLARFRGIPDVRYEEDRHFVSGNRGISEWTLRGTMTSGKRVEVRGCDVFEFRDDKIARKDSFWKIVE